MAKDVAKRQFRGERGGGRECVCAKRYEMRGRVRRPASGSGTDERKKKLLADIPRRSMGSRQGLRGLEMLGAGSRLGRKEGRKIRRKEGKEVRRLR